VFGNRFEVVVVVVVVDDDDDVVFLFFFPNFRTPVQIGKGKIKFCLANFPNRPEEDAAAAAEGYCRCCSLQLHFIQELFCGSRNPPPRELWSILVLVVVLLLHETQ
jgi:hypothetical protein